MPVSAGYSGPVWESVSLCGRKGLALEFVSPTSMMAWHWVLFLSSCKGLILQFVSMFPHGHNVRICLSIAAGG